MKRELQITADGSHTVAVPELHSTYHSTFGAIQESRHVFIEAGLCYVVKHRCVTDAGSSVAVESRAVRVENPATLAQTSANASEACANASRHCANVSEACANVSLHCANVSEACANVSLHCAKAAQGCAALAQHRAATEQPFFLVKQDVIRIFEMGFGTGLNALLSFQQAKKENKCLYYAAAELYPLSLEEAAPLNYISQLTDETLASVFSLLHTSPWNEDVAIAPFFTLHKSNVSLLEIKATEPFHLIYFDAFAPDVQPELWTEEVFAAMYNLLYQGGVLVTYCAKGSVRRAMQSAGFVVEKLKGPPGKREIVRAVKKA